MFFANPRLERIELRIFYTFSKFNCFSMLLLSSAFVCLSVYSLVRISFLFSRAVFDRE
jgi:hypothetical protein